MLRVEIRRPKLSLATVSLHSHISPITATHLCCRSPASVKYFALHTFVVILYDAKLRFEFKKRKKNEVNVLLSSLLIDLFLVTPSS